MELEASAEHAEHLKISITLKTESKKLFVGFCYIA